MSKKTRAIVLTLIIIAGTVAVVYIWMNYGYSPNSAEAPQLTQKTNGKIMLDGTVLPDKIADLGFINPATITSITKKVGDTVKAGDVLAVQNNSDLKVEADAAQASTQGAQSQLDKLNHDLKVEKLKLHGLSGSAKRQQEAQISASKDSLEVQESAITVAKDNALNAQLQLAKTVLKAPFDGVVTRQDAEVGEVSGVYSPSFMTLESAGQLKKIEAYASDLDVANLKIGDTAQVAFDFMGTQKTVSAKVTNIDPAANSSVGKMSYKVTLMLDQTDEKLKSGMYASVTF